MGNANCNAGSTAPIVLYRLIDGLGAVHLVRTHLRGGEGVHQKRTIAYVGGRGGLGKMYVLYKKNKNTNFLKNSIKKIFFFVFWPIFAPGAKLRKFLGKT